MADKTMTYKCGDRVVIKPWKLMEKQGILQHGSTAFTEAKELLLKGTDRVIEIATLNGRHYLASFPRNLQHWVTDDMILGYAFEYGQEIEVSDDGVEWDEHFFVNYNAGASHCIRTIVLGYLAAFERGEPFCTVGYKHARPIQEEAEKDILELSTRLVGALRECRKLAGKALTDAGVELT